MVSPEWVAGLLLLLIVVILPVPRTRQLTAKVLFSPVVWLVVLAVLALVWAFLGQEQLIRPGLSIPQGSNLEGFLGIALNVASNPHWLILLILVVSCTLPMLLFIKVAITFANQTDEMKALRQEITKVAALVNTHLDVLGGTFPEHPRLPQETLVEAAELTFPGCLENQTPAGQAGGEEHAQPPQAELTEKDLQEVEELYQWIMLHESK